MLRRNSFNLFSLTVQSLLVNRKKVLFLGTQTFGDAFFFLHLIAGMFFYVFADQKIFIYHQIISLIRYISTICLCLCLQPCSRCLMALCEPKELEFMQALVLLNFFSLVPPDEHFDPKTVLSCCSGSSSVIHGSCIQRQQRLVEKVGERMIELCVPPHKERSFYHPTEPSELHESSFFSFSKALSQHQSELETNDECAFYFFLVPQCNTANNM